MSPSYFINQIGSWATLAAALAVVIAGWRTRASQIWKEEAEAQKARADRLLDELKQIKEKLTKIEADYDRLVRILAAIDPERLNQLRGRIN